jgi:hypothetical protein
MGNLLVVYVGELVKRQKALVGVETEMAAVVIGEIPSIATVADDEQLQKTQQGFTVAVARVILVTSV